MRQPGIVRADVPAMTLRVFHRELTAAVVRVLKRANDLCSGSHGACIDRIGVGNHDVGATSFHPAQLGWRLEAAAVLAVLLRAEHDHAVAQCQLGVGDGSVFAFKDSMTLKAEDIAEPFNSSGSIAIAQSGDDGAAGFSHGETSAGRVSRFLDCQQSYILAVMELPEDDSRLVQTMNTALAEAAERAGKWLACRPGCTACCHGAFAINALDALRLRSGMEVLHVANPAQAAEIERRAQAWIAANRVEFPGDAESGRLGDSDADHERFEEFANDAACPALNPATGCCDVYAWRPMTCRVFGPPVRMENSMGGSALAHCELCFGGASKTEVAACEMPVAHELEAALLEVIPDKGLTVVAYALMRPGKSPTA